MTGTIKIAPAATMIIVPPIVVTGSGINTSATARANNACLETAFGDGSFPT